MKNDCVCGLCDEVNRGWACLFGDNDDHATGQIQGESPLASSMARKSAPYSSLLSDDISKLLHFIGVFQNL